jgi:hypothetical protein
VTLMLFFQNVLPLRSTAQQSAGSPRATRAAPQDEVSFDPARSQLSFEQSRTGSFFSSAYFLAAASTIGLMTLSSD